MASQRVPAAPTTPITVVAMNSRLRIMVGGLSHAGSNQLSAKATAVRRSFSEGGRFGLRRRRRNTLLRGPVRLVGDDEDKEAAPNEPHPLAECARQAGCPSP